MIITQNRSSVSSKLLDWYNLHNYDFPWRNTHDPYSIWISEVMLQQTRVANVLPYYDRWLYSLPTIQSVSETHIDNILKLWEGLGYYARARNFHKACQIIIDKHVGNIPCDPNEFSKLPGVGPYICAAVMSIAFNMPIPAIDGNAVRVVSRLNAINISYPKSEKKIFSLLSGHIDPASPGAFNQAVMDLGREICTPKNPSCYICPVNMHCRAYVNNVVDKYPIQIKKPSRPKYHIAAGLIWKNGKILISKRNSSGLLGGLWELPWGKIKQGENGRDCVARKARETLNVLIEPGACSGNIKHSYTHFLAIIDAYDCKFVSGRPSAIGCADFRWIYPYEVQQYAFHRASQKIFDKINRSVSV